MSPRFVLPVAVTLAFTPLTGLCAAEPNEKAERLFEPLLRRPGSAPLFERFVNAWLDTATLEELEAWLQGRVQAAPSAEGRLLLALYYTRQSEPVKALEQFHSALADYPANAGLWYQKALLEARTLDFEAAAASLRKCLDQKPGAEQALDATRTLGRVLARAGRVEEALQIWRGLLEARPKDEELREDILELQIAENLWPAAEEAARQLVEMTTDPYRRVLRRLRLGDIFDRSGQRDKALETFAGCLAETGAGSWMEKEIVSQIEKLFRREDDVAGLREFLGKLLPQHRHRAHLHRLQARLLLEAGEPDAAIAAGRTLLELSPGDQPVQEEFIALLTTAGKAAEAVPQLERLLKEKPGDIELRLALAGLKFAAGDKAGALTELRTGGQQAAGVEGFPLRLAALMERYAMPEEAVTTLRASLAAADSPDVRLMLASMLHKTGKKEEALAEWKRVASAATLPVVQQAAQAMHTHGETEAAWQLMLSRAADAGADPLFLTRLCALADNPERARLSLPFVRQLVELSRLPSDLNSALDAAQRVVRLTGNLDAVIAELTASVSSAQAWCLLSTLKEAARDTAGATAALEKARELSAPLALAQLVRLWSMRGDFAQAAAAAESLFNSPGGRQGHVAETLVTLYQRAGNPEAALRWTREWQKVSPGAPAPVLSEVKLLESQGREAEALSVLRRAAGRFEGNADIRTRLADLSMENGRTADAIRLYSTLYEEAPDITAKMRWVQAWARAAQRAGKLEDLTAQFEERRRENRSSPAPLLALAELHRLADNYDARRAALMEAARLKPGDVDITIEIARLETRENNYEAAIRTLQPVVSKDTGGRASSLMAELLLQAGRPEEGLKALSEASGRSPAAVESAALALARRDDDRTILAWLRPWLEKWPDDWRLGYLAASIEWRAGQRAEAAARAVSLLGMQNPLPRAAVSSVSGPSFEELFIRSLPPDMQPFFQLLAVRSQSGVLTAGQFGSRQNIVRLLPSSPDELRCRAAAMLLDIARVSPAAERTAWLEELERHGFKDAALVPELPPLRRFLATERSGEFTALLQKYPRSRALLALAAFNAGYREWDAPAPAALAEKVWEVFHDDAPVLALYLALPGAGQTEQPAAWEQQVLAALAECDGFSLPVTTAVLRALSPGDRRTEDSDSEKTRKPPLPAATRDLLLTALQRQLEKAQSQGAVSGYTEEVRVFAFNRLAAAFVTAGRFRDLALLLDAEWSARSAAAPGSAGSSDESPARPLGFPPWFLPGLPESVRDVLQNQVKPPVAAQTLPYIKDPLLRLFVAARAPAAAAGDVLRNPGQPQSFTGTALPYILAAALAEKQGDYSAAAEHAVKALYLPLSPEVRRRLDGALLWWAVRKGKPDDALTRTGREAALRLRRDATGAEFRAELATCMDRLGLTEEADRLMRQDRNAAGGETSPLKRAERLLLEGRTAAAVPLLAADLRNWAREWITNSAFTLQRNDLEAWRSVVQPHGVLPEVLLAVRNAGTSPRHLAEYAAACDILGDEVEARRFYEEALAAGAGKGTAWRLFLSVVKEDHSRALALMDNIPDLWKPAEIRLWMARLFAGESKTPRLEEVVHGLAFLEQALGKLPAEAGREYPAGLVLEFISGACGAGDFYSVKELSRGGGVSAARSQPDAVKKFIDSLLARVRGGRGSPAWGGGGSAVRSQEPPAAETARVQRLADVRFAAYQRVCRRLMTVPGCGFTALEHLREAVTAAKKDSAALLTDTAGVLIREAKLAHAGSSTALEDHVISFKRNFENLAAEAARAGRLAECTKDVVPAIRDGLPPEIAGRVLQDWPLWEEPAAEFSAAARILLKERGPEAWESIATVAAVRRTGVDLNPDMLETFRNPAPGGGGTLPFYAGAWCRHLEEVAGRPAAEAFVRELFAGLTGPSQQGCPLLKNEQGTVDETRFTLLYNTLGSLAWQPAWTGTVLRMVRDDLLPHLNREDRDTLWNNLSEETLRYHLDALMAKEGHQAAKAFLDSLPVTEELPGFFAGGGMTPGLIDAVRLLGPEERAAVGLGGRKENLTFGRRFLLAAAEEGLEGVCVQLAGARGQIEALPEIRRHQIKEDLCLPKTSLPQSAPAKARAFYEWLAQDELAKRARQNESAVTGLLEKVESGEVDDEESLAAELSPVLADLAPASLGRAREIVSRVCREAGPFEEKEEEGSPLAEALMELVTADRWADSSGRAFNRRDAFPWSCGILAAGLRAGLASREVYTWTLGSSISQLGSEEDTGVETLLERFAGAFERVWEPGEARLLTPWLLQAAGDYQSGGESAWKDGIRWVENRRKAGPDSELLRVMEMALRFHQANNENPEDENHPAAVAANSLSAPQAHLLELLKDETLPLQLRLNMGVSLLQISHWSLEPPLVHQIARLLRDSLTEKLPVLPQQESAVYSALANVSPALRDQPLIAELLPLTGLTRIRRSGHDDHGVTTGLNALLELALTTGSQEVTDRILQKKETELLNLCTVATLARQGEKERLGALLKERPEILQEGGVFTFDATLETQLPGALEAIADPVVRFETLVRLSLCTAEGSGPVTRTEIRAADLARQIAAVPWRNPVVKDRVISCFTEVPGKLPGELIPLMEDAAVRVPLAVTLRLDSLSSSRYLRLASRRSRDALMEGDFTKWAAVLHGIRDMPPDVRGDFRSGLLLSFLWDLIPVWPQIPGEARKELCREWRNIVAAPPAFSFGKKEMPAGIFPGGYREDTESDGLLYFGVLLHALADRLDELAAWQAALPEETRLAMRAELEETTPATLADRLTGTAATQWMAAGPAVAERVFLALAVNPVGGGPGLTAERDFLLFPGATAAGFLKLEEPLTKAYPDDKWLHCAFLRCRAATGAWQTVLDRSAELMAKETPARDSVWAVLLELHTRALEHLGRGAEALPRLEALPALPVSPGSSFEQTRLSRLAAERLQRRLPDASHSTSTTITP